MRFENASDRGKAVIAAICEERVDGKPCRQKCLGENRSAAKKALERHDKDVHAPDRKAEKETAKAAKKKGGVAKRVGGRWQVITDPSTPGLSRAEKAKLVRARQDELKDNMRSGPDWDDIPVGSRYTTNGNHVTAEQAKKYNLRKGDNLNGALYDNDGRRVSPDFVRRLKGD